MSAEAPLLVPRTTQTGGTTPTPETTVVSAAFVPGIPRSQSQTYETLDVFDLASKAYVASIPTLIPNNYTYFVSQVLLSPDQATCYEIAQLSAAAYGGPGVTSTWFIDATTFQIATQAQTMARARNPKDLLPIITPIKFGPYSGYVLDATILSSGVMLAVLTNAEPIMSSYLATIQTNGTLTPLPSAFGTDYPLGIASLPNGDAVVSRQSGAIAIVDGNGTIVTAFPTPTPAPSPSPVSGFIPISYALAATNTTAALPVTYFPNAQTLSPSSPAYAVLSFGAPPFTLPYQIVTTPAQVFTPIFNHAGTTVYAIGSVGGSPSNPNPTDDLLALDVTSSTIQSAPLNVPDAVVGNGTGSGNTAGLQFGLTEDDTTLVIPATVIQHPYGPFGSVLFFDSKSLSSTGRVDESNDTYPYGLITR
jgi:hypothetical protein